MYIVNRLAVTRTTDHVTMSSRDLRNSPDLPEYNESWYRTTEKPSVISNGVYCAIAISCDTGVNLVEMRKIDRSRFGVHINVAKNWLFVYVTTYLFGFLSASQ